MLESVVANAGRSVVRIYRWETPTISLGHFQKSVQLPSQFASCPVVNRLTGGGAILHDREITYSFAVSAEHPFRHDPVLGYVRIHEAIIGVLGELGVRCQMRGEPANGAGSNVRDETFLCFLRQDPRDVVIGEQKIIGSAQRRRKGSILQHGSILMRASDLVPEIPGIVDLYPEFPELDFEPKLAEALRDAVAIEQTGGVCCRSPQNRIRARNA